MRPLALTAWLLALAPAALSQTITTNTLDAPLELATPSSVYLEGTDGVIVMPRRVSGSWEVVAYATADGGTTWGRAVRLDSDTTGRPKRVDASSAIIVDGVMYALWADDRESTGRRATDLYFSSSSDGGATWTPELRIDKGHPAGGNPVRDFRLVAAQAPSSAHVLFVVLTVDGGGGGSDDELYFVPSYNGGATFLSTYAVSSGTADIDEFSCLIADGNRLVVAWLDDRSSRNRVYFRQMSPGGGSWAATEQAVSPSGAATTESISLARRGSRLMIAWQEEGSTTNEQLFVATSTNGGTSFGSPVLVGNYTPALQHDVDNPVTAIGGSSFFAAWNDNRTGRDEVYVARSSDGITWVETALSTIGGGVGGGGRYPVFPRSSTNHTASHVSWTTYDYPSLVETAHTSDGGLTWPSVTVVSSLGGYDADAVRTALDNASNTLIVSYLGANNLATPLLNTDDAYVSRVDP